MCVSVYDGFCGVSMGGWFGLLVAWGYVLGFVYLFLCVLALGICSGHWTVRLLASNVISGVVGFR